MFSMFAMKNSTLARDGARASRWKTALLALTLSVTWAASATAQGSATLYGAADNPAVANESTLYTIDPSSGAATSVGPIPNNDVSGLAFVSDGTLVGASNVPPGGTCTGVGGFGCSVLISIDPATGASAVIGEITDVSVAGECSRIDDLTFDPTTRTLYGLGSVCQNAGASTLFSIDVATGDGTILGTTGILGSTGNGLAREPATGTLFATLNRNLFTLSAGGTATQVGAVPNTLPTDFVNALAFHPLTGLLYGSNFDSAPAVDVTKLLTINTADGEEGLVGATQFGIDALAFQGPGGCPDSVLDGCVASSSAKLQLNNKNGDARLDLKKLAGATTPADFGDPTTTTSNSICLYTTQTGEPNATLSAGYGVPPSADWKADKKGFKFKSKAGVGGFNTMTEKSGDAGKGSVSVKGKGVDLPALPLPSDVAIGQVITDTDNASCFEGSATAKNPEKDNDAEGFKGSTPK